MIVYQLSHAAARQQAGAMNLHRRSTRRFQLPTLTGAPRILLWRAPAALLLTRAVAAVAVGLGKVTRLRASAECCTRSMAKATKTATFWKH